MTRIGARVADIGAALEVADELQHATEAEGHPVLEDPHRLHTEHFRVPARRLVEIAARHGHMRDVATLGGKRVVEQSAGGADFSRFEDVGNHGASLPPWPKAGR